MMVNGRLLSHQLNIWIGKALYALLIFWVCGVGPLVYFESFSAHLGVRGYHPIILGQSAHSQLPPELVQALSHQQPEKPSGWLTLQPSQNLYYTAPSSAAHFLLTTFRDGYRLLLNQIIPLDGFSSFSTPIVMISYGGASAWLPPPEKPPPFYR